MVLSWGYLGFWGYEIWLEKVDGRIDKNKKCSYGIVSWFLLKRNALFERNIHFCFPTWWRDVSQPYPWAVSSCKAWEHSSGRVKIPLSDFEPLREGQCVRKVPHSPQMSAWLYFQTTEKINIAWWTAIVLLCQKNGDRSSELMNQLEFVRQGTIKDTFTEKELRKICIQIAFSLQLKIKLAYIHTHESCLKTATSSPWINGDSEGWT